MQVLVARGAGLDVHRDSIVAVVLVGSRKVKKELRKFGTTSAELDELRRWLQSHKVTHVAMEATGVYWFPVVEALEGQFELVVANAHHVKNVSGRKTDACDAEWLATLLRHGLIKSSFVPPPWQRELRVLTRSRSSLVHGITRQRNLVLKLLESVGIKLASVLSDVFGVSGMAILRELRDGNENPELLSDLAKGRLRRKMPKIVAAIQGRTLAPAARLVLAQHLRLLDQFEEQAQELDAAIEAAAAPYSKIIARLRTIPGVNRVIAMVILAEVGPDVAAFDSCDKFAAWSGTCPGNARSANRSKRAGVQRAMSTSPPPWSRLPSPLREAKRPPSSVKSTVEPPPAMAPNAPPSPQDTRSPSPSTTCSATALTSKTSALPVSRLAPRSAPSTDSFAVCATLDSIPPPSRCPIQMPCLRSHFHRRCRRLTATEGS